MILGVRLRLQAGRRLTLGVATSSRIVFALLFCLSLYTLLFGVLFAGEDTVLRADNAVPWILVLATAAAMLYEERWIFDGVRGTMEGRFGLLFVYRKRVLPIRDLREIRVERFRRGSALAESGMDAGKRPWRTVVRLTVTDCNGTVTVLDTTGGLRAEDLRRTGKRIGEYCGVPFVG